MLVTVLRYQAITGDTTTAASAVSARIEEATEMLEGVLDRPLTSAERTERMWPQRDGSYLPHAIPVTDPGTYTLDGDRLIDASISPSPSWPYTQPDGVDITYTGGWVERTANPTATNALPLCIERDIAFAAYMLGQTDITRSRAEIDADATSVTLGDASVSYRTDTRRRAPGEANVTWSRRTLGYRYRRVGGYR